MKNNFDEDEEFSKSLKLLGLCWSWMVNMWLQLLANAIPIKATRYVVEITLWIF
jgi:hypothetical protein